MALPLVDWREDLLPLDGGGANSEPTLVDWRKELSGGGAENAERTLVDWRQELTGGAAKKVDSGLDAVLIDWRNDGQ